VNTDGTVGATALFVEVLVVGIGVLACLLAILLTVLGKDLIGVLSSLDGPVVLLSGLSLSYVLGIIVDRLADQLFQKRAIRMQEQSFANDVEYETARAAVLRVPAFSARLDYSRSRLRVVRGWSLNGLGLLVSGNLLLLVRYDAPANRVTAASLSLTVATLVISIGSLFAWQSLAKTQYQQIAKQYRILVGPGETVPTSAEL
jgi:hypothetical protein